MSTSETSSYISGISDAESRDSTNTSDFSRSSYGDSSTQLEHEETKHLFQRLISNSDKSIADESVKQDIQGSNTFQDVFCCQDPIYTEQVTEIRETVPSDKIRPDTVGSYLYGCFQKNDSVEVACTPACIGGFKNPHLEEDCTHPVYHKADDRLSKLNTLSGDESLVFISSDQDFTVDDQSRLIEDGISSVTIYRQEDDSIDYQFVQTVDLTEDPSDDSDDNSEDDWTWVWVLLIIVLVILILIGVSMY